MINLEIDESSLENVGAIPEHVDCLTLVNRCQVSVSSEDVVNRLSRENDFKNLSRVVLAESSMLIEVEAFSKFESISSLSFETNSITDFSSLSLLESLESVEVARNRRADYSTLSCGSVVKIGIGSPTEQQLIDIAKLKGINKIGIMDADFFLIPAGLPEGVSRLSIIKGKGGLLDLSMVESLVELELRLCAKLEAMALPANVTKLRLEDCKKCDINKIIGGDLRCLVLQNIAPAESWESAAMWPSLTRIGMSGTWAKNLRMGEIRDLCDIEEISAPSLKMTEEEAQELSKINRGILVSVGGYIFRNGTRRQYWEGSRDIL